MTSARRADASAGRRLLPIRRDLCELWHPSCRPTRRARISNDATCPGVDAGQARHDGKANCRDTGHAAARPRRRSGGSPAGRACASLAPAWPKPRCAKKGPVFRPTPPRRAFADVRLHGGSRFAVARQVSAAGSPSRCSEEPRGGSACSVARSAVRLAPESALPHRPDHGGLVPRFPFDPKTDHPSRTARSSAGLPFLAAPLPFLRRACAIEFRPPCLTTPWHFLPTASGVPSIPRSGIPSVRSSPGCFRRRRPSLWSVHLPPIRPPVARATGAFLAASASGLSAVSRVAPSADP